MKPFINKVNFSDLSIGDYFRLSKYGRTYQKENFYSGKTQGGTEYKVNARSATDNPCVSYVKFVEDSTIVFVK